MTPNRIEGYQVILGESQGFGGLPVKLSRTQEGHQIMISSWAPTPMELTLLNAGAPVYLYVVGNAHPPVIVGVGPAPEDAAALSKVASKALPKTKPPKDIA